MSEASFQSLSFFTENWLKNTVQRKLCGLPPEQFGRELWLACWMEAVASYIPPMEWTEKDEPFNRWWRTGRRYRCVD